MAQVANPQQLLQQLQQRRAQQMAPAQRGGGDDRSLQKALKEYVNAEPWIYFDTQFFGAGGITFAAATNPLAFFTTRTIGNTNVATTSMTDTGKMDADFKCYSISVDVLCDSDCAAAAGIATAGGFVETYVHNAVLQLTFGSNTKLILPIIKAPTGGGVFQPVKVRTQTAAANSDSSYATNGEPTGTARRLLDEPIFFKQSEAFGLNLTTNATALARIQALQALTGNFQALIRVNLEGVRGKPFLQGTV